MLEVPATFDRSQGDVHSLGNPHFLVDPLNAKIVAAQIADHFAQLDPASADAFRAHREEFDLTLDAKLAEWQKLLEPFRDAKIVTYHRDFSYLAARFGLEVLGTLEAKPGIPPSPAHLAEVIEKMKASGARVILVQPYQNRKTAETVARATGAAVLDFPQQPGAVPDTATYFRLMDHLVRTLAHALQEKP